MPMIILPRSGRAPVQFNGELLAQASSRQSLHSEKQHKRWHEITVYQTDSGKYVVHVAFRCDNRYDAPHDDIEVCATPADVVSYLSTYHPTAYIRGWPLPQHKEHDARLRQGLTDNFEAIVADVLCLYDVFAERV